MKMGTRRSILPGEFRGAPDHYNFSNHFYKQFWIPKIIPAIPGMLATCFTHPADTVKVRMQLGEGSALRVARTMVREQGLLAFYRGLPTGLLRQAAYTTTRIEFFRALRRRALAVNGGKPLPLYQESLCALTAGVVGACVAVPLDLALIRIQADASLPPAQRRNYLGAKHALRRIISEEGVLALWKGGGPTVLRAMTLNTRMLVSYHLSIQSFMDSPYAGKAKMGATTAVSLFFVSACSLPFDYVKTQIQQMQPDASGKYPYTGYLDCAIQTLKSGGPFKFYRGFPCYYLRIAPHAVLTFIFYNEIEKLKKSWGTVGTHINT